MFVTNWILTTKIQKISEITNFFRHYFLSRTEVPFYFFTFKSPFLPLKAFFLKNSLNFATLCNIFSNFAPKS